MITETMSFLSNQAGGDFNLALFGQIALLCVLCLGPMLVIGAKIGGLGRKREDQYRRRPH